MKNVAVTIFIILIVITLGLYLVSFQVRETESCIVMTFGKADKPITEPGLYFKWPFPIQQVVKYDSRMKVYAPEAGETSTALREPIIVNTYVVWRISDPLEHYKATSSLTVRNFEDELLRKQIQNIQGTVIGEHYLSEFVNSDETKIKFAEIENEMLEGLQKAVSDANYGIEVKALGIKQLKVSEDVTTKVFDRMRSERREIAEDIRTQGQAEVINIEEDARRISEQLKAAAQARAKRIMGKGDAEAAKFYKMLDEDPEFANLLLALEALPEMLGERTTYLLSADTEPFTLLRKIPDLKPKDPNETQ